MPCCPRWPGQVDFKMNTNKLMLRGQNLGGLFKLGKTGNTKGEVSLYCGPPVGLVWNQLCDN